MNTLNALTIKFSKVGTTSAQFLKIGVGRATGMGEAFSAISDDASATYFNPAGLAQLIRREVFVSHINWIADVNHDYLAVALPIKNIGTLGFSFTAVTMGEMQKLTIDDLNTRIREDDSTGVTFGAMDAAFGISYARQITDKLCFGITAKGISQSIWNLSATGMGLDLGLLYNTGFRSLRLAACVSNFGTSMAFSGLGVQYQDSSYPTKPYAVRKTTATPLPTTFRFGISYNIIDQPANILTFACDVIHPNDINETVNFGLEYVLKKIFFLRTGYIFNTDVNYAEAIKYRTGLSAGAGFITNLTPGVNLRIDYCYKDMGWLKASHRLGLIVGF
jgi:hypothetical protein